MRIAWLIDVQAPYREPMYAAIARRADFRCYFFFREEKIRHFRWRPHPGYRSEVVRSLSVRSPDAVRRRIDHDPAVLAPGVTRRILEGIDVVGIPGWQQPVFLWTALRARRRGIPYIMFYESTLDSRRYTRGPLEAVRSWMLRHAGAVVVPTPGAREAALASGAAPDRVVETVNSIDLDTFAATPRALRTEHGHGSVGVHRFAYVGQLIARKNVGALVEAFAAVTDDAVLEIAGDGVELADLRALAERLGVTDRVRFHGFLEEPDVVSLLARTYTLVLPSTEEVYGMTALEAHVAGCQVVVSTQAGVTGSLAGAPGVYPVEPTVEGISKGLDAAVTGWDGWAVAAASDLGSPERTAADVVAAAERALETRG